MKRIILLAALLLSVAFFSFEKCYAIDPECLMMLYPDNNQTSMNPDSIKIDTCTSSPTFGQWYAKKGIKIIFWVYPFEDVPIPANVNKFWYDIDTTLPELRSKMFELYEKYGEFTITRKNAGNSHLTNLDFILQFNEYICLDSLFLDIVDSATFVRNLRIDNVPQTLGINDKINNRIIYNDRNILKVSFDLMNNTELRLIDIYGNIFSADYEIIENSINVNIENLSVGVYFIQIGNSKPIKFVKY